MSKAVIRSAKPYWIYLILTGKKSVEVGKDFPKSVDWNRIVEMYCSKDMRSFSRIPEEDRGWMRKYLGKVACRFVCLQLEEFTVGSLRCDDIEELSCLSYREMMDYFYKPEELDGKTAKTGFAWHISDLVVYDKPKEFGDFKTECKQYGAENPLCDDCKYFICCRGYEFDESDCAYDGYKPLERPFQSWGYVEEV